MTLEGTPLLFLRKNKKRNNSFGLDLKAPFGDGDGCSAIRLFLGFGISGCSISGGGGSTSGGGCSNSGGGGSSSCGGWSTSCGGGSTSWL